MRVLVFVVKTLINDSFIITQYTHEWDVSLYRIHKSLSYKNPKIRLLNAGLNIIVKFTKVYMNLAFNVIVFISNRAF